MYIYRIEVYLGHLQGNIPTVKGFKGTFRYLHMFCNLSTTEQDTYKPQAGVVNVWKKTKQKQDTVQLINARTRWVNGTIGSNRENST